MKMVKTKSTSWRLETFGTFQRDQPIQFKVRNEVRSTDSSRALSFSGLDDENEYLLVFDEGMSWYHVAES